MLEAEKKGIILQKKWISSNQSGRTRDWHFPSSFESLEVDTDKPFVNGMGKIMYPGDPSAKPANVYNCRCTMAAVVKGFKKVENASESVDITAESGIIKETQAMYRKSTESKIEPMPAKQLHRIEKSFKKQGGLIQRNDATDEYLNFKKVEGITYNATTVLLKKKPGRASVFEELIHTHQYKVGKNDGSYPSRLVCEIEAQKKLLKHQKAYKLTEIEVKQTQKALEAYEAEYVAYIKKGGN